ncbi:hypothetical protein IT414_01165 [bacterium]|nr:hypothetical protein [bacterium]
MKKDDAKPNKPEEKPAKKKANTTVPKDKHEVVEGKLIEQRRINLNTKKHKSGLTLGQWQELSQLDHTQLTPTQRKQLEDVNKAAADTFNATSQQYDFAAMFKTVSLLPIQQITEQARDAIVAMNRVNSSLILPAQQLAQFQQNLLMTNSVISQALLDTAKAASVARSIFASFEDINTQFIKALQIDIPSLGIGLTHISATEIVTLGNTKVGKQKGYIAAQSDTTQVQSIEQYELVSKGTMEMVFTKLASTEAEVRTIRSLIESGSKSSITRLELADIKLVRESSTLKLAEYEIPITVSSDQARFCAFFFASLENFRKKWDIVEFMEDAFGRRIDIDGSEAKFKNQIKGLVHALNTKFAANAEGQFKDFFMLVDYTVYINPKYIS